MGIELELDMSKKKVFVKDASSIGGLNTGFFGKMQRGIIELEPQEALYLIDVRNAKCLDSQSNICTFNDIATLLYDKISLAKYFAYSAWRNRGLIAKKMYLFTKKFSNMPIVLYPSKKFEKYDFSFLANFYPNDLTSVVQDDFVAKKIYEDGWFGQYGSYKNETRGTTCKLDAFETLFLQKYSGLEVHNQNREQLIKICKKRRNDFEKLNSIYEDWRLNGFILKTGFKFGTHFRVYFPGAGPFKGEKWTHSKHVLHVFAKKSKMLISEWARAIRVAHSVRKTFVLAIEGQKKRCTHVSSKTSLDFVLYHRKKDNIAKPNQDDPKYLMMALYEEQYLSAEQLAHAIEECKQIGLGLILAIVDRETSVTFYEVKRIDIPGSDFEYYELEWVQP